MLLWAELNILHSEPCFILPNLVTIHIPHPSCAIEGGAGHVVTIWGDSYGAKIPVMSPFVCFELSRFYVPCLYLVVSKDKTSGTHRFVARMPRLDNTP